MERDQVHGTHADEQDMIRMNKPQELNVSILPSLFRIMALMKS